MNKINLKIDGMHCASCEVLIERKFKNCPGVERVNVDHTTGKAEIQTSKELSIDELNRLVKEDGYTVSTLENKSSKNVKEDQIEIKKDHIEIGAAFLIIGALYLFLKQFELLPSSFGISNNMSYLFIFGLGLVAAFSTCLAVSGGLLLAISNRYNEQNPNLTSKQKFKPHIYFNVGRIVGYTLFGGLVGALGSVLVLSSTVNGILTIFVSLIMISLGFQMLGIFPWMNKITPKMPKFLAHKIYDSASGSNKPTSFLFGASTFFLPCGFTQALQFYVLSTGNFTIGALTMLVFSLGTLPTLLSLGAVSSFSKGIFQRHFIKFAAVLVIMLGVFSINNGLALTGNALVFSGVSDSNAIIPTISQDGKQVIEMKAVGLDYYPDRFNLKRGVPVEWRIDGTKAQGCIQIISVPKMNIMQRLSSSEITVIKFTPQEYGNVRFTCGMGMAGPGTFMII